MQLWPSASSITSNTFAILVYFLLSLVGFYKYRKRTSSQAKSYPFPPGPPAFPIIGNIFHVNPQGGWYLFTEYKSTYGDLVFFHGLGNNVLVLNSIQAVNDLLDKRGETYSDRPVFTVVGELMGLGQSLPLLPYGKKWRESRKLCHGALSMSAIKKYHRVQEDMAALLNKALLQDPESFFTHVRTAAGRIILSLTYGFSVEDTDEKYITHAEKTMHVIGRATVPGAFLCDLIPIMKYLPAWVPFQREAARGRVMIETLVTRPFEDVNERMANGTASPSLTQDLLSVDALDDAEQLEHVVKWTAGALYGAGGETTYATVLCFIMVMALNPEKQRIAQAEVDNVIGEKRLPVIGDRDDLPYVNATIKEVMRWHPALPLSIARMSSQNDVYDGYHIPKGTIVIPNVWAIAQEQNEIHNAQEFIPERFLGKNVSTPDPARWAFGFGRRICPGKALAENSLFVIIAGILSAFDVRLPVKGHLKPTFCPNLVSYPDPFECQIIPRSEKKSKLIYKRAEECVV